MKGRDFKALFLVLVLPLIVFFAVACIDSRQREENVSHKEIIQGIIEPIRFVEGSTSNHNAT